MPGPCMLIIGLKRDIGSRMRWYQDRARQRFLYRLSERPGSHSLASWIRRQLNQLKSVFLINCCLCLKRLTKSITYDNGSENTEHEMVNHALGTSSYFCNPYHSWEKGTVENTIGLVRRFLPKKTNFNQVTPSEIKCIEFLLNNRPRKCLNYYTPLEAITKECCT